MEVFNWTIKQLNFKQVSSCISLLVSMIEERYWMQRLMDVANHMNQIPGKQWSLGSGIFNITFEGCCGLMNSGDRAHWNRGVVDDWNEGIGNIWTGFYIKIRINKMPFVPDVHAVLSFLNIVGPYSWLNERACFVIAEVIDGKSDLSEIARGIYIELIETNLCDGCCEHMANIPPASYKLGQINEYD